MTKQADALAIVMNGREYDNTRKQMIGNIERMCGVGSAYASTLYNNARKTADSLNGETKPTKKPTATTHEKSTNIETIDRATVKRLRLEFQAAIEVVAKAHGLTANLGNIRFDNNEFTTKMTVETSGNKAAKESSELGMFKINAIRVGLDPEAHGKTFCQGNDTFRITGVKPRRRKYPVSAENVRTGAKYKFPVSATGMEQ